MYMHVYMYMQYTNYAQMKRWSMYTLVHAMCSMQLTLLTLALQMPHCKTSPACLSSETLAVRFDSYQL